MEPGGRPRAAVRRPRAARPGGGMGGGRGRGGGRERPRGGKSKSFTALLNIIDLRVDKQIAAADGRRTGRRACAMSTRTGAGA